MHDDQKKHGEILKKIASMERVNGIEKDPLLSKDSDIVVDYNMVPGFIQREKSMIPGAEDKLKVQPHAQSLKFVENMLMKGRKKHEQKESEKREAEMLHPTEEHPEEDEPIASGKDDKIEGSEENKKEEDKQEEILD